MGRPGLSRLLQAAKPAAPARAHLALAAGLWTAVGGGLLLFGSATLIQPPETWSAWLLLPAALLGAVKARWVLDRVAAGISARIVARGDGRCLGGFLSPGSWALVAVMAAAGRLLRGGGVPSILVGLLYIAVGTALVLASRLIWRAWAAQGTPLGAAGATAGGRGVAAIVFATGLLLALIWLDLLPWLRGPAPFPPEWQWPLRDTPWREGLGAVLLVALGLMALVVATGAEVLSRRARILVPLLLAAATVLGVSLQLVLLGLGEERSPVELLVERTLSPTFTSHFTVAASPVARDPVEFVDRHAELLPSLPVHSMTHPPGAVLLFRGVLAACEASPRLTGRLVAMARGAGVDPGLLGRPEDAPVLAAALLSPLLIVVLAAATCWPVTALARGLGLAAPEAVRIGLLWPLIPGPALMVPELDQLLALPVAASAALLLRAAGARATGVAVGLGAAAGAAAGLACLLSYGAAAFAAFAVVLVLAWASTAARAVPAAGAAGATAAGFVLLPALLGHEPLAALAAALRLHRELFTEPRCYWIWLPLNLWDLAVFLGFPLAILAAARAGSAVGRLRVASTDGPGARLARLQVAAVAAVLLLDATGAVRGEAGRIWIPLMPFLLVAGLLRVLPVEDQAVDGAERAAGPGPGAAAGLAALLLACSVVLRLSWRVP